MFEKGHVSDLFISPAFRYESMKNALSLSLFVRSLDEEDRVAVQDLYHKLNRGIMEKMVGGNGRGIMETKAGGDEGGIMGKTVGGDGGRSEQGGGSGSVESEQHKQVDSTKRQEPDEEPKTPRKRLKRKSRKPQRCYFPTTVTR